MKYCPFCGSPAANWPEYASDYVKGYPLCEHHMSGILENATVRVYEKHRQAYVSRWEKLSTACENAVEDLRDEICKEPDRDVDPSADRCSVYSDFCEEVYGAILECPVSLGEPIKIYIDEEHVDRIMANRLKAYSRISENDRRLHRCSAIAEDRPDGRCIRRVKQQGDICRICQEAKVGKHGWDKDKLDQLLEVIRS